MSPGILGMIRERVETLAAPDGEFVVRCARTGEQPVPVDGRRFPDRETAAEAAQTAAAYRAVLCRYDPRAPVYDFIVCESVPSNPVRATDGRGTVQHTGDGTEGQV